MTMAARVPRKSRELCNHHLDSRIWNAFEFRPGDVIVATYPKSGTTWMQQIVAQLVFAGAEIPINRISPWMDSRLNQRMRLAALAAQRHPRILKSHLPLDALVYSPRAATSFGAFTTIIRMPPSFTIARSTTRPAGSGLQSGRRIPIFGDISVAGSTRTGSPSGPISTMSGAGGKLAAPTIS